MTTDEIVYLNLTHLIEKTVLLKISVQPVAT